MKRLGMKINWNYAGESNYEKHEPSNKDNVSFTSVDSHEFSNVNNYVDHLIDESPFWKKH
ncbi:MAG: hypothetical protein SO135_08105 [Sphaerochaetaceae bacterium]|jgi:hypothetical protein|nr:hypothetical protein [Sphaerochaetaceae bacterium]